jgi:hypothetical protein
MTNYKMFYDAWLGFAKPKKAKRQLLLENTQIAAYIKPEDFLALTTDAEEMESIKRTFANTEADSPDIRSTRFPANLSKDKDPLGADKGGKFDIKKFAAESVPYLAVRLDNAGNAKVFRHEGRHRCYAIMMYNEKVKNGIIKGGHIKETVPLIIDVENADNAKFSQIAKLIGEIDSDVTISRFKLAPRDVTYNADDPLRIGDSKEIFGYAIPDRHKMEVGGFRKFIQSKYSNDISIRNEAKSYKEYSDLLNNAYTVTDSDGATYVFETNQVHPIEAGYSRGILYVNLSPHPASQERYGSIAAANEKTYILKKKQA